MGWRALFIALHVAQVGFIAFLVTERPFVDPALYASVKNTGDLDALHVAVQIGRLDVASLGLAFIGIILAVTAIFSYFIYGHVVTRTTEKETREIAPEIIEKFLRKQPTLWLTVIRENPDLIRSALHDAGVAFENGKPNISGAAADAIAAASGEENDDEHVGT